MALHSDLSAQKHQGLAELRLLDVSAVEAAVVVG